jgi:hypothetical protein
MSYRGNILVDLDGTLAKYYDHYTADEIGEPIQPMLDRIRKWLKEGYEVRVFTARASVPKRIPAVREWLDKLNLHDVGITNSKDFNTVAIFDDRAEKVVFNTGLLASDIIDRRRVE